MRSVAWVVALASTGCNLVFGLDAPALVDGAAPPPLDGGPDAAPACTDPGGLPDEDGDLIRDACDNCPHRAQTTPAERADPDGDGIGVACDPDLFNPDHVVAFYGFAEEAPPPLRYILGGTGAWGVRDGELAIIGTAPQTGDLAALDVELPVLTVEAEMTLPATLPVLAADGRSQSVGVWANIDIVTPSPTPGTPYGNLIELFQHRTSPTVSENKAHLVDTTPQGMAVTSAPDGVLFLPGERYRLTLTCGAGQCSTVVSQSNIIVYSTSNPSNTRSGSVGLRAFGLDARFHYLMVYAPGM